MLGLCCWVGVSLVVSRSFSLFAVHEVLIVVASLVAEHRFESSRASGVAAPGL